MRTATTKKMRAITTKKQRQEWLDQNRNLSTLVFRWGKTGYHACTIYDMYGDRLSYTMASGCGYDKQGTALGRFMMAQWPEYLNRIRKGKGYQESFYGLIHYNTKTHKRQSRSSKHTRTSVDGGCGWAAMTHILNKIGFKIVFVSESKWETTYRIEA